MDSEERKHYESSEYDSPDPQLLEDDIPDPKQSDGELPMMSCKADTPQDKPSTEESDAMKDEIDVTQSVDTAADSLNSSSSFKSIDTAKPNEDSLEKLKLAVVEEPKEATPRKLFATEPCLLNVSFIKPNILQATAGGPDVADPKKSFNFSAGETGGGDAPFLGMAKVESNRRVPINTMDMSSLQRCLNEIEPSRSNNGGPNMAIAPQQLQKRNVQMAHKDNRTMEPAKSAFSLAETSKINAMRYSRKVFVGGLPPDIDEYSIEYQFKVFGPLSVDWPHKIQCYHFPPKGFCFLIFHDELSVYSLISSCTTEEDRFYYCVSSPSIRNKTVQVRPWHVDDAVYMQDDQSSLDPRKTIFLGGVPRPLKAVELAMLLDQLYGDVCYVGIDTDTELLYPRGSGRVAFKDQRSYIKAVSSRFITLNIGDSEKRIEVKPYMLNEQTCDICHGQLCGAKFANYFCSHVKCLKYFCDRCWAIEHGRSGFENHQPLVKDFSVAGASAADARWRSMATQNF